MDLLRIATAGSVDDGKSTLIGRLLYDSKALDDDVLAAVEEASWRHNGDYVNLALVTDGPARRTGAGYYHRRCLPLLLHSNAQVHPGRHAGACAVHAQHGHRGVHRRGGAHHD